MAANHVSAGVDEMTLLRRMMNVDASWSYRSFLDQNLEKLDFQNLLAIIDSQI
jgi:hypothetical protein